MGAIIERLRRKLYIVKNAMEDAWRQFLSLTHQ